MMAGPPEHTTVIHGVEYARVYRVPSAAEPGEVPVGDPDEEQEDA